MYRRAGPACYQPLMTRLLPFVVLAAACGGKFAAEKPPAGMTFKDMNHAQRIYFMEHTVMPEMNVTEDDSRDITAYLYTLR